MNAESDERTGESADGQEAELGSRAPEFIKSRRGLHLSWQVGVFIVGLAVVGAGVVMLPLPGPGWLVIFGGMAIWATEFGAARAVSPPPPPSNTSRPIATASSPATPRAITTSLFERPDFMYW